MERKVVIAGNWKMNKTDKDAIDYINSLSPLVTSAKSSIYLAVPFTALQAAKKASENTNIIIGAQNMHDQPDGAFTGEISGLMLKTAGSEFVIIGHSERRHIFKENDEFINKKVIRALMDGIQPILCIGETEDQREKNETQTVLETQLTKGLQNVSKEDVSNIIIAYEPVWAIGTGKTATNEIAESAHLYIRKVLTKLFDKDISEKVLILYGGSVKPQNIEQLMQQQNIDGALVGGAALDFNSFAQIINKS